MPALGDVSVGVDQGPTEGALGQAIPAWPDVSQSIPDESSATPGTGGFSGHFSFG